MEPIAKPRRQRPFLYRTGFVALRLLALAYGMVLLGLVLFEARLVYPGAYLPAGFGPPKVADSPVQTVQFQGADGTPLAGRLLERSGAQETLLYLHGNGTKAIWLDARLQRFSQRFNANVLAAEFQGFDDNDSTPSEASLIADAGAARQFLCTKYGLQPGQILLYGRSLGGGVAAALAADGGARAVILERTFDSMVNVAAGHYSWIPVRWLMRNRYDSITRLKHFQGPVIQLHGTIDRVVPIERGQALYAALTSPQKAWIQVESLGHNDHLPRAALTRITQALEHFTETPIAK